MKFEYKGEVYDYVGVAKMKQVFVEKVGNIEFTESLVNTSLPYKAGWLDCIVYSKDGHVYVRELTDFLKKFKLYSDHPELENKFLDMYDEKAEVKTPIMPENTVTLSTPEERDDTELYEKAINEEPKGYAAACAKKK